MIELIIFLIDTILSFVKERIGRKLIKDNLLNRISTPTHPPPPLPIPHLDPCWPRYFPPFFLFLNSLFFRFFLFFLFFFFFSRRFHIPIYTNNKDSLESINLPLYSLKAWNLKRSPIISGAISLIPPPLNVNASILWWFHASWPSNL